MFWLVVKQIDLYIDLRKKNISCVIWGFFCLIFLFAESIFLSVGETTNFIKQKHKNK